MNAGKLDKRLEVLSFSSYAWNRTRYAWASMKWKDRVIYSNYAVGTHGTEFTIRKTDDITPANLIRFGGQYYMLASIHTDETRRYLIASAAEVSLSNCTREEPNISYNGLNRPVYGDPTLVSFPGILSQKYINIRQEQPNTQVESGLILTTPKEIVLETGEVLTIGVDNFSVKQCYLLDHWHNDFEVVKVVDA